MNLYCENYVSGLIRSRQIVVLFAHPFVRLVYLCTEIQSYLFCFIVVVNLLFGFLWRYASRSCDGNLTIEPIGPNEAPRVN